VGNNNGQIPLYSISENVRHLVEKKIKRTALGVTSFSKSHVLRTLLKALPELASDSDSYIDEDWVDTITIQDLQKKFNLKVEILNVDIEGFDYIIIENFDFKKNRPSIINYESKNLSSSKKTKCENILINQGYNIFYHGGDTLAFCLK